MASISNQESNQLLQCLGSLRFEREIINNLGKNILLNHRFEEHKLIEIFSLIGSTLTTASFIIK